MSHRLPKKVFYGLLFAIFILLILNIWSYLNMYHNNLNPEDFFFRKTNFNEEKNAPSIFSSILHFTASILLAVIGFSKLKINKHKAFWLFLSFLLLFTGLDELLRIHEKVGKAFSENYVTSGIFFFSWVIPYGIAVMILGLVIFRPLFQLPKKTVNNFITAGFLFLLGAVGVEMFTGWYIGYKEFDLTKLLIIPDIFVLSTIEELLEMLGMSFFIYSLLKFLSNYRISQTSSKILLNKS